MLKEIKRSVRLFMEKYRKFDFYLAGPMRGYPKLNGEMFSLAARLIRSNGRTVWSPAEHNSYLDLSFAQCMTADLNAVIVNCRRIALLPGWRDSLGANMEAFCAFACGKEAVEIVLNEDKTNFEFISVDLSRYALPYNPEKNRQFDPHNCDLHSFDQKSS